MLILSASIFVFYFFGQKLGQKNLPSQKFVPTDVDPKFEVKIGWGNFWGFQIFDPIFDQK